MKRIMLRVAALVTVVVLGLIAIAQAQRSTSSEADPPLSLADASTAEQTAASNPLRGPAAAAEQPRPTQFTESPLRSRTAESAAPPAELPESTPADPFRRPAPDAAVDRASEDMQARYGTALTSHEEQPSREPAGVEVADAGGTGLRPYPSSEGDRYPSLRPPQEGAGDPPAAGPSFGVSLASNPPANLPPANLPPGNPPPSSFPAGNPMAGNPMAGNPLVGQVEPPAISSQLPSAGLTQLPAAESTPQRGFSAGLVGEDAAAPRSLPQSSYGTDGMLGDGSGKPGALHLEGTQTPQVSIEKIAPPAMQVGKTATFVVKVRNTGAVAATGVEVRDQVPKGTQLNSTTPRASQGTRGELIWSLGTLEPGGETSVEMQVTPTEEGEIGSVATVHFSAAASAKGVATKPELLLESSAPAEVLIGETFTLSISVSNPGSGVATGVVLSERIPPGLRHAAGADLEYDVGSLQPGESRKLELELVADRPGPVANVVVARGEGNLRAEHQLNLSVVAPQLEVAVGGPQRRFLEREAVYELGISNPGTAAAKDVELVAHLPDGLEFVSANNAGHYDEATRAVYWRLDELPVRETGTVKLVTMPIQAGEHALRIRGKAAKGVETEAAQPVIIEGIAALLFEVRDVVDPIEVNGETVYEISVLNQGSKAATNVRVHLLLPPEMQPIAAEGPAQHVMDARQVAFEPLARLAPKADTVYRVRVRGLQPGDLRVRVQVLTDEMHGVPVTKEESTRVYSDQ
ncbi:MAG: hypothetical protein U1E05_09670 [Patescibacteria group bacterium]|nr:hypothetical protein [Patescibacteria group bacterium]